MTLPSVGILLWIKPVLLCRYLAHCPDYAYSADCILPVAQKNAH